MFSEDLLEMDDDRGDEPKSTKKQIKDYLENAGILADCNYLTEDSDQLTGASLQSIGLKTSELEIYRP